MSQFADEITAEDEAQDEDEDARPEDDHVDVEGQVLEGDGWHGARLVGVNQSQTTEAPVTPLKRVHQCTRGSPCRRDPIRVYQQAAAAGAEG